MSEDHLEQKWCQCINTTVGKLFNISENSLYSQFGKRIYNRFGKSHVSSDKIIGNSILDEQIDKNRIMFSIRFVGVASPGLYSNTGYYIRDMKQFKVSQNGWKKDIIANVEWVSDIESELLNREVVFSLSKDLNMKQACEALYSVIESLTGDKTGYLSINIVSSCRNSSKLKVQLFDEELFDFENITIESRLKGILRKRDIASISILMPYKSVKDCDIETYNQSNPLDFASLQDFVPEKWRQIEPWAIQLLETKITFHNALLIKASIMHIEHFEFNRLLDNCKNIPFDRSWCMIKKMDKYSLAHKSTLMPEYATNIVYSFLRTAQLLAARAIKAESELLQEEILVNYRNNNKLDKQNKVSNKRKKTNNKKSKKKKNKDKKVDKTTIELSEEEVISEEDVIETLTSTPYREEEFLGDSCLYCGKSSVVKFQPCGHKCLCKSCLNTYSKTFMGKIECIFCRIQVSTVKVDTMGTINSDSLIPVF